MISPFLKLSRLRVQEYNLSVIIINLAFKPLFIIERRLSILVMRNEEVHVFIQATTSGSAL